jgi:uncharacterized protein (DUF433 family)
MPLNTGIYTAGDAAALLREDTRTVRRWAFGYPRSRRSGRIEHPPLIRTELPPVEGQRALTFVELVELLYVRAFHELGVSWSAIREAARVAASLFASPHPFALRQVYLDPESVLYGAVTEPDGTEALIQLRGHGQQAFPQVVKPYLDQLEFGVDDLASRWWPMGRPGGVLVDPRVAFGSPIVEAVGIRVETLADAWDAESPAYGGRAAERVAWMYEIEPKHVHTALGFRQWLRTA